MSGRTVVVADDDADIRRLVEFAVTRAGCVLVGSVASGTAALAAIREHRPSLAVLDVAMPGMTGLQVCAAIRADPTVSGMRVLLLSASVHDEALEAGDAAGADDYLPKPFRVKELAARIAGVVSGPAEAR